LEGHGMTKNTRWREKEGENEMLQGRERKTHLYTYIRIHESSHRSPASLSICLYHSPTGETPVEMRQ